MTTDLILLFALRKLCSKWVMQSPIDCVLLGWSNYYFISFLSFVLFKALAQKKT